MVIRVVSLRSLLLVEATTNECVAEHLPFYPWVTLDLIHGDPLNWVVVEHALNQVLVDLAGALAELLPELVGFLPQHLVELDCWEGVLTHDHHEEDDAQRPDVSRRAEVLLASLNLWGHVQDCTTLLGEPVV